MVGSTQAVSLFTKLLSIEGRAGPFQEVLHSRFPVPFCGQLLILGIWEVARFCLGSLQCSLQAVRLERL